MIEKIEDKETEKEEFGELLKFTAGGFVGGFLVGVLLDYLGFQRSAIGQWIVRTLSGEYVTSRVRFLEHISKRNSQTSKSSKKSVYYCCKSTTGSSRWSGDIT